MKQLTRCTIWTTLQENYGVTLEATKMYERIEDITKFHYTIIDKYPHLGEEHFPIFKLIIEPLKGTKQAKKNSVKHIPKLTYFYYVSLIYTLKEKPFINYKKQAIKQFSEDEIEEFIDIFKITFNEVVSNYCQTYGTTLEKIVIDESGGTMNEAYIFVLLMESMLYNVLIISQQEIIKQMHEVQNELIELLSYINFIDISEMDDMIKKLKGYRQKIQHYAIEKSPSLNKHYFTGESVIKRLEGRITTKNNNYIPVFACDEAEFMNKLITKVKEESTSK